MPEYTGSLSAGQGAYEVPGHVEHSPWVGHKSLYDKPRDRERLLNSCLATKMFVFTEQGRWRQGPDKYKPSST